MLVGPHDRAIDKMAVPVELTRRIGLLLDGRKEAVPEAGLAPAVQPTGHGGPRTIPCGQIAPRRPGAEDPQEAIEEAAMVHRRTSSRRFLGWKQGVKPLPLRIGECMSVHRRQRYIVILTLQTRPSM